jgi:hypothetical protein
VPCRLNNFNDDIIARIAVPERLRKAQFSHRPPKPSIMESFAHITSPEDDYKHRIVGDDKSTILQIAISATLGISAFIAFCVCV